MNDAIYICYDNFNCEFKFQNATHADTVKQDAYEV